MLLGYNVIIVKIGKYHVRTPPYEHPTLKAIISIAGWAIRLFITHGHDWFFKHRFFYPSNVSQAIGLLIQANAEQESIVESHDFS